MNTMHHFSRKMPTKLVLPDLCPKKDKGFVPEEAWSMNFEDFILNLEIATNDLANIFFPMD